MLPRKIAALLGSVALASTPLPAAAQVSNGPGPLPRGDGPGCDFFPAPASVGAAVGLSYFGPPPSQSFSGNPTLGNPSLVGPVQLLRSGQVNEIEGTVTLPLYRGKTIIRGARNFRPGEEVLRDERGRPFVLRTSWYILSDTSDEGQSTALGLNYAPKLQFVGNNVTLAYLDQNSELVFEGGSVDFSPDRSIVPGPGANPFPPASVQAGSVGDADYFPVVRIQNAGGVYYNAPLIAFDVEPEQINFPDGNVNYSLVHDGVIRTDTGEPFEETVTMNLTNGTSFGRPVWYLSTDASDPVAATLEHATFAPRMAKLVVGRDDSFSSAVERIFVAVNGPSEGGCANPARQGLTASVLDGHKSNNVFGGIPTIATDYSPLWDLNLFEWTPEAIRAGYRHSLNEEFRILQLVQEGILTGPGGADFGSTGIIINCAVVQRLV